jgi:secreted Zn-dependent insulinase-like peptidase
MDSKTSTPETAAAIIFEKSERDLNQYQAFTLKNGLQCLLIQDNNTKEISKGGNLASVSLAINCGCLNDPITRQGLAHFLEHMIFMGSTKYPDENGFSNHINMNGGYSNAFTDNEITNYHFRVNADGLYHALDMFAWLLIAPLLKEDA